MKNLLKERLVENMETKAKSKNNEHEDNLDDLWDTIKRPMLLPLMSKLDWSMTKRQRLYQKYNNKTSPNWRMMLIYRHRKVTW